MAKVIYIKEESLRPGQNELNNVVSVYDDDVELGDGYASFGILNIPGVKAKKIQEIMSSIEPVAERIFKGSSVWTFEKPQTSVAWKDKDGKWRQAAKPPKHRVTIKSVSAQILASLQDSKVEASVKNVLLEGLFKANISDYSENQTLLDELNG